MCRRRCRTEVEARFISTQIRRASSNNSSRSPSESSRPIASSVDCVVFFSSRRRHTRFDCDWSSDVCSSDLTHSICTLEFENHRPLYDWYIQNLGIYAPQQIEFAKLSVTFTVLSKRRLIQMVQIGRASCRERV